MRTLTLLVSAFISLFLVGCEEPPPQVEEVIRPVKMQTIGSLDEAAVRDYPGTIRAFQNAEVAFEVPGQIIEFFVFEGDEIVQGELLARLDPRDYEAELKAQQANVDKAKADYDRSLSIQKEDSGAISQKQIDGDLRAYEVAKANLEIAQKGVGDSGLRAPFSGRMARKLVDDFANVEAKEPILILQDTSTLEIEIHVPERDMTMGSSARSAGERTEGSQPKVIVSAIPDRAFPAKIKEFATTADPVTRTFAIKLDFENPGDVTILPGMTARVQAVVSPERAWSVPVSAAQGGENEEAFVWTVDPDSMAVARTPVELGELFGDRVMIKSGVSEGDIVAVSGVTQLREGMKVRAYDQ
jgi:RND family efflux transporter MFP subunit